VQFPLFLLDAPNIIRAIPASAIICFHVARPVDTFQIRVFESLPVSLFSTFPIMLPVLRNLKF